MVLISGVTVNLNLILSNYDLVEIELETFHDSNIVSEFLPKDFQFNPLPVFGDES